MDKFIDYSRRWLFLGFIFAGASACSVLTVPSPPSDPSERTADAAERCTTSALAPAADLATAAVGGINIAIASNAAPGEQVRWYSADMSPGSATALGITQLAIFGASAVYGISQTSRCRTLRREVEQEERRRAGVTK